MDNFNAYGKYYDLLYKDKDYKAEAAYVLDALQSAAGKPVKQLLELGAGSGSHAVHFCDAGCHVTGIERSVEMVREAQQKKIKNFKPLQGDIAAFNLNKKFDAAVSLFHVVSYLTNNNELIRCFSCVAQHLKKGGLFLFDIWYTPAVYTLKPETRIKRLQGEGINITRIAESQMHPNKNMVDVHYEVLVTDSQTGVTTMITETHPMRHFSLPEIELLASFTGFTLLHAEEFLTKKEPGEDTWGVCCMLQKK